MNDNTHKDYDGYATKWLRCRSACAGQAAVHAGGKEFLPMLTGQTVASYDNYKLRATYFNAAGRTLDGLVGMVFRKPIEITAPAGLQDIIDDIDLAGTPLEGLAMHVMNDVIAAGRIGLLVEYPQVSAQPNSAAVASALNLRPYVSTYAAESILNWKLKRVNNAMQPVMIKLMETFETKINEYEYKCEPQIRALLLIDGKYQQEIYRKVGEKKEWVLVETIVPLMNNQPIPFIPFWAFGGKQNTLDLQQPPIEPLCDLNLAHYRVSADYENGCHITGVPTPILAGFTLGENETINLGAGGGYATQEPNAKWGFLEFTGQGLGALLENLKLKEAQMAAIGARFLAPDKAGVEAAATLLMRSNGESSVLASMANLVSQNLQDMFEFIAKWAGIDSEIIVALSTDILPVAMTSQDLDSLIKSWQAGAIPKEELFNALKRGEVLTEKITYGEYSTALDAEKETITGII
jgi:Domain of unknown function (DUF4055)